MPSLTSPADQRASFSPSISTSISIAPSTATATASASTAAHKTVKTTTATTTTNTRSTKTKTISKLASQPKSSSLWTRRLELPSRPLVDAHSRGPSVDLSSRRVSTRNGCVISPASSSLSSRHAHTGEAMADRLSSFFPSSPSSSPTPPVDPAPKFFDPRHTAALSLRNDSLSAASASSSASIVANGSAENGQQPRLDAPSVSQQQLIEYREKLTRDLEQRDLSTRPRRPGPLQKARIFPTTLEGAIPTSSLSGLAVTTASSTESGTTIRESMASVTLAGTPSYPFPRMSNHAASIHSFQHSHAAFSTTSRSSQPTAYEYRGVLDRVLSESSTPASTFTFHPAGTPSPEAIEFPNPNLYDLSLMLSAEPGLDSWWDTVVRIMRDVYKAERVTLAVPADATDIENVPWGQKATYNEHDEAQLSPENMARGPSPADNGERRHATGSLANANTYTNTIPDGAKPDDALERPDLPSSRHSFSTYEENKEQQKVRTQERPAAVPRRPPMLERSKTHFSTMRTAGAHGYDHSTPPCPDILEQYDSLEEESEQYVPSWEAPFTTQLENQGRVLPVLQALNCEADPLIDHTGISRVLERGRTVALTRTYPYMATTNAAGEQSGNMSNAQKPFARSDPSKRSRKPRSESLSKLPSLFAGPRGSARGKVQFGGGSSSFAAGIDDDDARPPTPRYEEYEQTPQSPWSQSPAPSPAVRSDTKENPFFTDAIVDEECFNPDPTPTDYSGMQPPEAIGIDNSWTVLHIPLAPAVLSGPHQSFRLNPTNLHRKSQPRSGEPASESRLSAEIEAYVSLDDVTKSRPAPIAILSVLSPIIPYPANLRHSLDHLAPHMAHTFSLCRHHTNIETELAGLRRRRPHTVGFGAVTPYGLPVESGAYLAPEDAAVHPSLADSITSPSDYSKSATGSPLGTPGWDSISVAHLTDRRQAAGSPALISQSSGSYFGGKQAKMDLWGISLQRPRADAKDKLPSEKRLSCSPPGIKVPHNEAETHGSVIKPPPERPDDSGSRDKVETHARVGDSDDKSADRYSDSIDSEHGQGKRGHTMLHTYGADFSSSFQSLPPNSSFLHKAASTPKHPPPQRSGPSFLASIADMPPPSDRLKGLILDSLPAHVFVALPQTGEIVWVNSRYLSYRGQTVSDLSFDPWGSVHPDEVEEYLKEWGRSLRTGEQFSRVVRIRRFDGAYRWFYARAVASKDKRGVIMQFLGSYMDIHDQRVAEIKAARQEEIEASEAKHRLLANLIPQIIFTATEDDGITFANQQWLSYTGQSFDDALRLGFMDFVHPEDLAKCRIPPSKPARWGRNRGDPEQGSNGSNGSSGSSNATTTPTNGERRRPGLGRGSSGGRGLFQRHDSSSSGASDQTEVYHGNIKETIDSDGRPSYATEVRLRSKTGEYRWHLIRCVEIDTIDFGSGASSYFGSATDINDHKLLEVKLKEAMESKSRFLSNMSHEIRTPLIGISGMVSFLQDTELTEEQRDYTNTIQTSANSLIMIINDILDLSKVDAGMMKLKYEWFHTRSLIEDVNELVSTMAIAKRLELNYLVDADVPAWVKGDKVRIRQVLLNVIGNAIKFTTEGEVFSQCRVYFGGDNGTLTANEIMLEFRIIDTGRGFTEEEKGLIFKPFSQIDGSSTRQHGGSGLGLVISRQLVELHGGKMEGTAIVGQGSTFTFTAKFSLPTADDQPDIPGSPASTVSTVSTSTQQTETECIPQSIQPLPPSNFMSEADTEHHHHAPGSDHAVQSPNTGRSGSSVATSTGLGHLSEAARAGGQELSQMEPDGSASEEGSLERGPIPNDQVSPLLEKLRPIVYSILVICLQSHSREATTQHIEMTLPRDVPHQILAPTSVKEAEKLIREDDPVLFTHVVINLPSADAVIAVIDTMAKSPKMDATTVLILSDSVQRQGVLKLADGTKYEELLSQHSATFIYKPVKPSRFAVIFDPDRVRDLSTDWNRSTAQQMVETQKASYTEIERRMGHRGLKVLLVEDNPVNQKVLTKYLNKIGVDVEIAEDGVECTDRFFSRPHTYYSLILCDLHMPRKDGYQACREIRDREKTEMDKSREIPIIALSANVMSDVQEKCVAAGFSDYVTKPVDFIDLSRAMSRFF